MRVRLSVLTASVVVLNLCPTHARAASVTSACAAVLTDLEKEWGATGEWRKLAPYPVERDASPTDSVGVWLERWKLADGSVELRHVSAAETRVAALHESGCVPQITSHRRSFDPAAMRGSFTDDDLRGLLRNHGSGMIYVWSPRMPLSVCGIEEARAAARDLGIRFTALVADADSDEARAAVRNPRDRRAMESLELTYRDATIHYPTTLYYRDGQISGTAIPGYKTRSVYVTLGRERFARFWQPFGRERFARLAAPPISHGVVPNFWVDHQAQISTVSTVETPRHVGFFFKPVAGTSLVSYTSNEGSYLFDLATHQERRIPGNVDPVPSPDGRFITRPGLLWYSAAAMAIGDTTPLFRDGALPDEYQTLSILRKTRDTVRYRVITGWRMGIRYRDYDVALERGAVKEIIPLGMPTVPCDGRVFSLPISAKGSTEFGAFDTREKTNHIMRLESNGDCTDVLDFGFPTGKLSFSYDGSRVAFATSRVNVDAEGQLTKPEEMFYKDALVLFRATNRIVSLSANRPLRSMSFPEFLPDGRSIILDQAGPGRRTEVFRVLDVK
ncbi:MAG TPA: hypothetical protein VIV65_05250 [Gemmatimonadaceae bacterium]